MDLICPQCGHAHGGEWSNSLSACLEMCGHGETDAANGCGCTQPIEVAIAAKHATAAERMAAALESRAGVNPHAPTDAQIAEWRLAAEWHEDFLGRAGDLLGDWLTDDDQAFDGIVLDAIVRVVKAAAAASAYLIHPDELGLVRCGACRGSADPREGFTYDTHEAWCVLADLPYMPAPPATATDGDDE